MGDLLRFDRCRPDHWQSQVSCWGVRTIADAEPWQRASVFRLRRTDRACVRRWSAVADFACHGQHGARSASNHRTADHQLNCCRLEILLALKVIEKNPGAALQHLDLRNGMNLPERLPPDAMRRHVALVFGIEHRPTADADEHLLAFAAALQPGRRPARMALSDAGS